MGSFGAGWRWSAPRSRSWSTTAWRDLHARLKATNDAIAALDHFAGCPGVPDGTLEGVRAEFREWHRRALGLFEQLEREAPAELVAEARRHYANELARMHVQTELTHLAHLGLVSPLATRAAEETIDHLKRCDAERVSVTIEAEEDIAPEGFAGTRPAPAGDPRSLGRLAAE